jgi:hypothetical protein
MAQNEKPQVRTEFEQNVKKVINTFGQMKRKRPIETACRHFG